MLCHVSVELCCTEGISTEGGRGGERERKINIFSPYCMCAPLDCCKLDYDKTNVGDPANDETNH